MGKDLATCWNCKGGGKSKLPQLMQSANSTVNFFVESN